MKPTSFHKFRDGACWTALLALTLTLAAAPAFAQKIWSGAGDGTSWSQGANWVGGSPPTGADPVVLDNSMVAANYTVTLPSNAISVSIIRLRMTPAAGRTVTLVVPSGNTASPALNVGDGLAGTDDIVLESGAVLINRSGAGNGGGIGLNSPVNGVVRIMDGARYLHATSQGAAGLASRLSTAAGTKQGVFEYDVPGIGTVPIAASGITYGALKLTRTAGAATYTGAGAGALTVRGDFVLGSGVSFAAGTDGPLWLGGNLMNDGAMAVNSFFDVYVDICIVSGGGSTTLNGGAAVPAGGSWTISSGSTLTLRSALTNNGSCTVEGNLELENGGLELGNALDYGPASTLVYRGGSFTVANEWAGGSVVGPGVPANVTLDLGSGNTLTMPFTPRTLPSGNLTVTSGTIALNSDLRIDGDIRLGQQSGPAFHNADAHKIVFDGTLGGDHDVVLGLAGASTLTLGHLAMNEVNVTVESPDSNAVLDLARTDGGESLTMDGDANIALAGNRLRFSGTSTLSLGAGPHTIDGDVLVYDFGTVVVHGRFANSVVRITHDMELGLQSVYGGDAVTEMDPVPNATEETPVVLMRDGASVAPDHRLLYGPGAMLRYGSGNHTLGGEWSSGDQRGEGVPENVTIDAGAHVTLPGDRWVPGNLSIAGGELDYGASKVTVGRDLRSIWTGTDGSSPLSIILGRTIFDPRHFGEDAIINNISMEAPTGSSPTIRFSSLELRDAHVMVHNATDDTAMVELPTEPHVGPAPVSLSLSGNSVLDLAGHRLRFAGAPSVLRASGGHCSVGGGHVFVDADFTFLGENQGVLDMIGDWSTRGEMFLHPDAHLLGMLERLPGGTIPIPPKYEVGSTLVYNTGGVTSTGPEWSASEDGPFNITVASGTVLTFGSTISDSLEIALRGTLTVTAGAEFSAGDEQAAIKIGGALNAFGPITMSSAPGADWNVLGDLDIRAPITQNGNAIVLEGEGDRSLRCMAPFAADRLVVRGNPVTSAWHCDAGFRINRSLELRGGDIVTGPHAVILGPDATVTRTSGAVRGRLSRFVVEVFGDLRSMSATSPTTLTFDVGSAAGYAPVDVNYDHVAAPAVLTVSTTDGEHPDAAASGIDVTRDVNRYWTLSLDRAPDPSESFTATFHWLPGDRDPGTNDQLFDVCEKSATWTHWTPSVRGSDLTTVTGLSSYGDFVVGTPHSTTGVVAATVPQSAFMRMAGPNPFMATTAFAYGLPQPGQVKIEVYSVTGQRVKTLVNEVREAGTGRTAWDGRDHAGNVAAPGMYVARMEVNGRRFTLPLRLLR